LARIWPLSAPRRAATIVTAWIGPGATTERGVRRERERAEHASAMVRHIVFHVVFNRVNFDVPNRTTFPPNFGRIFNAAPARQFQFGVKAAF
jgi:hypothetical protein